MQSGPLRIVVGLGDPERERRLLPALAEYEDLRVVERCLSADQLLDAVADGRADVALLAYDLHRLGAGALSDLDSSRVPRILLVQDPSDSRWETQRGVVLPLDADADLVRRAIDAALRGERFLADGTTVEAEERAAEEARDQERFEETQFSPEALSIIGLCAGPAVPVGPRSRSTWPRRSAPSSRPSWSMPI